MSVWLAMVTVDIVLPGWFSPKWSERCWFGDWLKIPFMEIPEVWFPCGWPFQTVGKTRRWITLWLWENQWVEESRLWVIQLHGCFPLGVHWLACVNCHDRWGSRVHRDFRHCQSAELPSHIDCANVNPGVAPVSFLETGQQPWVP